jgi:hypothetical protein
VRANIILFWPITLSSLEHLRHQKIISVPYYLMKSLQKMAMEVQTCRESVVAHHGLIKILIVDALRRRQPYVTWDMFISPPRETMEPTQPYRSNHKLQKPMPPLQVAATPPSQVVAPENQ